MTEEEPETFQEKTVWIINHMKQAADDPSTTEGDLRDQLRSASRIIAQLYEWNSAVNELANSLKRLVRTLSACMVLFAILWIGGLLWT